MDEIIEYPPGSFECSECGREDFYFGTLAASLRFSIFRKAAAQCSVCLSCGHVCTFVDDADLKRIRAWKEKEDAKEAANA
jgi:hypothetical protein